MTKPKISIIIPVNNIEEYLPGCLETLVNQTFKDLEIICINDASDDNSLSVLKEFAEKDPRIIVISEKEQKGQAFARNIGLNIAKGEYIGFVDGDDWVEINMFEKLYESAKNYDADITICSTHFYNEFTQKSTHNLPYYNLSNFPETFDGRAFSPEETTPFILDINVAVWNKIYKRNFLNKINVRFKEGFVYEDLPFFYESYLKAQKISIVRDFLYFYRANRPGSTMANSGAKVLDRVDMASATYEAFKKAPFYEEIRQNVTGWIINDLFHRYTLVDKKYQKEFYFRMKKVFKGIDLKGIDLEELKKQYFYEEFIFVKNSTYDKCNNSLFLRYKNAKQRIKEIKHRRNISHKRVMDYYESKMQELEENHKSTLEYELKVQREWFDNLLKLDPDGNRQEKLYEMDLQQKKFYENELRERIAFERKSLWEEFEKTKKEIDSWHENNLYEKLNNQKIAYEKRIEQLEDFYENEINQVKFVLKVVKKLKKIKLNLKNRIKL